MEFVNETAFDRTQYDTYLVRLKRDPLDAMCYRNMLLFLWDYILKQNLEDMQGLYEEYTHWNIQMIDKVLFKITDLPYAEVNRCYQSVVCLLMGEPDQGMEQLCMIREHGLDYDGLAPKTIMVADGTVYRPMSKLFILYNYEKYFKAVGDAEGLCRLKEAFPYAFSKDRDSEDDNKIYYPVFHRVYRLKDGYRDFFIYTSEDSYFNVSDIANKTRKEI